MRSLNDIANELLLVRKDKTQSARLIGEMRALAGLSQERFAEIVGVHQNTVRRWESGLSCMPSSKCRLLQMLVNSDMISFSGLSAHVSSKSDPKQIFLRVSFDLSSLTPEKRKEVFNLLAEFFKL